MVAVPWMVPITFVVGIVFVYVAVTPRPMTLTTIVHCPGTPPTWAGIVPPVSWIFCVLAAAVRVPPQSVEALGGVAIRIPFAADPGSGSNKLTLTKGDELVLTRVIVRVESPLGLTVGGKNALLTVRVVTLRLAVAFAVIVRPWVFVMFAGVTVFVTVPGVLLVTHTSRLQVAFAANEFNSRLIEVAPLGAFRVLFPAAPHPAENAGGVELLTVTPAGRLSVIEKLVRAVSAGAMIERRRRELPPAGMVALVKLFVKRTGRGLTTVIVPDPADPLQTPSVEQTDPTGIVFVHEPSVVACTWAVMIQVPGVVTDPPGMVALVRVRRVGGGPRERTAVAGGETQPAESVGAAPVKTSPAGKLSISPTPV